MNNTQKVLSIIAGIAFLILGISIETISSWGIKSIIVFFTILSIAVGATLLSTPWALRYCQKPKFTKKTLLDR